MAMGRLCTMGRLCAMGWLWGSYGVAVHYGAAMGWLWGSCALWGGYEAGCAVLSHCGHCFPQSCGAGGAHSAPLGVPFGAVLGSPLQFWGPRGAPRSPTCHSFWGPRSQPFGDPHRALLEDPTVLSLGGSPIERFLGSPEVQFSETP